MGKFNLFQKQRLLTFTGQVFGRDYLSRGNKNMKDEENDKQILARLTELLSAIDQQGKKIDDITTRLEKLEKNKNSKLRGISDCDGGCFGISEECVEALNHPEKYQPQPGEKYSKEGESQANYKKSFWKKVS